MMWESPIHVFTRTVAPQISEKLDGAIFEAVLETNIEVDRDELIKALAYDRHQYDAGYSDGLIDAQPKWISVKDRLPEDDADYLVWVADTCTVERAMYYGDGEWLTEDLDDLTRLVTHWMPLPEPPKEE